MAEDYNPVDELLVPDKWESRVPSSLLEGKDPGMVWLMNQASINDQKNDLLIHTAKRNRRFLMNGQFEMIDMRDRIAKLENWKSTQQVKGGVAREASKYFIPAGIIALWETLKHYVWGGKP